MIPGELCKILDWDSSFFEFRIGSVCCQTLTIDTAQRIEDWCKKNAVKCLYFFADPNDRNTIRIAEDNKYRLVDLRLKLRLSVDKSEANRNECASSNSMRIRPAIKGDLITLEQIAQKSYRDSRFYFDGRFPADRCDALYVTWIRKSCEGYADAVLVAENDNRPVGFITCHVESANTGSIGLTGVAETARGLGVGECLVRSAELWFRNRGTSTVTVVTQGRNIKAQRLYQRCNFLMDSLQLSYHRWFD